MGTEQAGGHQLVDAAIEVDHVEALSRRVDALLPERQLHDPIKKQGELLRDLNQT
ncbi:hypothetical protein DBIPINDM_004379 [Mesorhizobium sp. AR02]|uniref:hypothetical protein n=1 Tax=Mesorhizobium sp. AR02 TaxID=2865837 RepID=UPI00215FAE87|nr:hypothetical protein [Mesorhizobium sp. AR02]UVK51159.1 hypothetical protein DBIPINDM_004379 [Mesorhizobium sp. AR02]